MPDRRVHSGCRVAEARGAVARSIIRALAIALDSERPVDWQLRQFFRNHPSLGRRDRGLVAETLFDVLRNRRLYLHLAQGGNGSLERRLMLLSWSWAGRRATDNRIAELDDAERRWLDRILQVRLDDLPPALSLSVPDWLYERLQASAGDEATRSMLAALLAPAPLDLRVNLLKATRDDVLAALAQSDIRAQALDSVPTAIRVEGKPALERTAPFEAGWVEVQDAGSQALAYLAAPRRGQIVVDFCAGAGGKSLAMATLMRDSGQLFACDVSLTRLQKLRPRLARAGVSNIQPFAIDNERDPKLVRLASKADVVLVDAPCSGLGTVRRNPDLKWRWQMSDIAELQAKQISILQAAAELVKPGGVLVYATCSLLAEENEEVCAAFERNHPQWLLEPADAVLAQSNVLTSGNIAGPYLKLRPDLHGTDGFFAARWRRPATAG